MRVLIFHGYLLRGTGSNVYTASLCRTLVALGHEVHVLSQDRSAAELDFVDAVGDWEDGALRLRAVRDPVRCTAYVPDIGGVLPVYVADEYEGLRAVTLPELDGAAIERYLAANVAAVADVAGRARPDVALANHLVMGPVVIARALRGEVPYAVKVHGSALEYTVRPHRQRFVDYAQEGLAGARAVLVGSRHTAESLWEVMGDRGLPERTRLGPPGVDVASFRPRGGGAASEGLHRLASRVERAGAPGWGEDAGAAAALRALDPVREPIVAFVGKLIVSKGVDLLLAAWPLVVARVPAARLCVVGFGTFREGLDELAAALSRHDLDRARTVAERGRELEGGPRSRLRHLAAFIERLGAGRLAAPFTAGDFDGAAGAFERIHLTGRLEHADLPDLLPACSAQVVPSTFPEAFGMVAAEAACCGVLPLSAAHSGLAEVTAALSADVAPDIRSLLSFPVDDDAVEAIAARLVAWLTLDPERRVRAAAALSRSARGRYGWERVAEGALAAAAGRLDELPEPVPPTPA